MSKVKFMDDYDEIKNNLHEERISEAEECQAIINYVIDAGLFLDEEITEVLNELDYKIEDLDNWLMLNIVLERLKMEFSINSMWGYIEEFKENNQMKGVCDKYIDNANILYEASQGGGVVLFRKGHTATVLEIYYPYQ